MIFRNVVRGVLLGIRGAPDPTIVMIIMCSFHSLSLNGESENVKENILLSLISVKMKNNYYDRWKSNNCDEINK